MDGIQAKIDALTRQINELAEQQSGVSRRLIQLMKELDVLKQQVAANDASYEPVPQKTEKAVVGETAPAPVEVPAPPSKETPAPLYRSLEEFIGKNIASKVGILVTITGIFIGARYAIEHNMVNPVVRVISGYINGLILIAISLRLKKKYEGYSAVLMGGGLAVLYFITYIAYGFYSLVPQTAAFVLMLLFTAAIVYAALWYNKVIIAHLAQVGAYAIPFLLSDNSGRYGILFSYVAIVNTGILFLSFRKYWKSLFYAAFAITWLMYLAWYVMEYKPERHFNLAFVFLAVFFLLFYGTFLSYKLIRKEKYVLSDITILLFNTFLFYGIGYNILNNYTATENGLGLFTVVNAAIHFVVSLIIRRLQLADKSLYYLVLGLVIVFLTIAIPVQLDGNWVTLLWTAEAVLVFIIGRTQQASAYEKLGVGLVSLSLISLIHDWINDVIAGTHYVPFFQIVFLTGLLVCIAQAVIIYFNNHKKYSPPFEAGNMYKLFYDLVLPSLFIAVAYVVFFLEINRYFEQLHDRYPRGGSEINVFALIALLIYSVVFMLCIYMVNRRWVKNKRLAGGFLLISILLLLLVLAAGLPAMNTLSVNYYYGRNTGTVFGPGDVLIRYVLMIATAGLLYAGYECIHAFMDDAQFRRAWTLLIHFAGLGFLSAEYLQWATVIGSDGQYKLGLSILWGLYALFLVVYGVWKKQRHLRIAAIVLFVITLIKLFFYDLAEAGTITKTVSFLSLGAILLLVSYLYSRYEVGGRKPDV